MCPCTKRSIKKQSQIPSSPRTAREEKIQKKGKIIKIRQLENEGRILTSNDISSLEDNKRKKKDVRNALHYTPLTRMFPEWVYSDVPAKTYWLCSQAS